MAFMNVSLFDVNIRYEVFWFWENSGVVCGMKICELCDLIIIYILCSP